MPDGSYDPAFGTGGGQWAVAHLWPDIPPPISAPPAVSRAPPVKTTDAINTFRTRGAATPHTVACTSISALPTSPSVNPESAIKPRVVSASSQLRSMSGVLPPVFLLVAAFLVNMTLTRLIALEREQIAVAEEA